MKKKTLLIMLSMVVISVFSISATIAYFTDVEGNANVFTSGKVAILLNETKTDELGNKLGDEVTNKNEYHLMPGYTYSKDPTVTVKNNSADSYVRLLVTLNNVEELKDIYGDEFTLETIYSDWGNNWEYKKETKNSDETITYEYRYKEVVNGLDGDKKLEPLFKSFKVPEETTIEQLKNINGLEISIIAQAIQGTGFNNADEAWDGFNKQYSE